MLAKPFRWALAGLVACPSAALALGLGDIHLQSRLNAPLNASIDLVGVTPDQLASLKPQIASRETFAAHGLDWSPLLANVTVRAVQTADGKDVLELRSTQPVTEPFLTVLIELDWDRGQFVREYDLLLDPPVYAPSQTQAAQAIAAPTTGAGTRQGAIERPAAAPGPAPSSPAEALAGTPAAPSAAAAPSAPGALSAPAGGSESASSYEVHRGDTLSRIALQFAGAGRADEQRWMVAAYQANPGAFEHNMNWLRAGAVLRVPSASAVESVSAAAASAEVRRQYVAWRGASASGASSAEQTGRLRLVVPGQSANGSPSAAGEGAGAASQRVQALQSEVQSLQSQLANSRRMLDISNAELKQLQARLAAREGETSAAQGQQGQAPSASSAALGAQPVTPAQGPSAEQTPPAEQPAVVSHRVVPVAGAAGKLPGAHRPLKHPRVVSPPPAVSPFSALIDTLKGLWWVVALAVVALLAYFGLRGWSSRRKAGFDDSLGRLAEAGAVTHGGKEPAIGEPPVTAKRESGFLVEETGSHERPRLEGVPSIAATRHVEADEGVGGETTVNLDQGDPLAEADFHMAYGLYDQAADLVRIAIQREPERRDLKLKLLEVFFVWGNKEQFLLTARDLAATRAQAAPGEWEKIVIMGKQLAPDDPLFAGGSAAVSGATAGGVDLDLEGGQHRVDFDVVGEPSGGSPEGVDLDIGTAVGERDPVAEAAAQQMTDKNLALDESLVLPEDATTEREAGTGARRVSGGADAGATAAREMTGSTREMLATTSEMALATREMAAATREMTAATREMTTTLERDSWNPAELARESPTVEQPALRSEDNPTIRQKVEMALRAGASNEHTTELALDDLGLDLRELHDGPQEGAQESEPPEIAVPEIAAHDGAGSGLDATPDAPTLVAGLDEHSRRVMEAAEQRTTSGGGDLKISETGTWHFDDDPFAGDAVAGAARKAGAAGGDLADTSRLAALKSTSSVDFEIGESQPPAKVANGSNGIDLDIGVATVPDAVFAATQRLESADLALPSLDPVTMSEVGTKLDLARAYMDMGDPEGARNILEEVLTEGSVAQKQEAERLIASLPG